MRRRWAMVATLVLAAALAAGYVYWDNHRVVLREVTIGHAELPPEFDGYRILHLTDLEGRQFGEQQQRLVQAIRRQDVDMVLLTGDYVRQPGDLSDEALAPLVDLLAQLPSEVPKYYVLGDNEIPWGHAGTYSVTPVTWNAAMEVFETYGVEHVYPAVEVARGGASIWLTGWEYHVFTGTQRPGEVMDSTYVPVYADEDPESIASFWRQAAADGMVDQPTAEYRSDFERAALEFLARKEERDFRILVSHRPVDFGFAGAPPMTVDERLGLARGDGSGPSVVNWQINIAGHTHGGLWRPPLVGPVIHPNLGLFPPREVTYGLHADRDGHRRVWISSGLGAKSHWFAKARLFNPPEAAVLTLRADP